MNVCVMVSPSRQRQTANIRKVQEYNAVPLHPKIDQHESTSESTPEWTQPVPRAIWPTQRAKKGYSVW